MALLQLTLLPLLGWQFLPFGAARIRTLFWGSDPVSFPDSVKSGKDTWKGGVGGQETAPKKYPVLLGNVSKDKRPSIQYYFAK